jgi:hypothetical protein
MTNIAAVLNFLFSVWSAMVDFLTFVLVSAAPVAVGALVGLVVVYVVLAVRAGR